MKKFFTLVSVAMAAMSLNAQVEKYTAITFSQETAEDGSTKNVTTLSPEFAAAVTDAEGNIGEVATNATAEGSVINFGTANVEVKAVGGSTPADVADDPTDADGDGKADNMEDTHTDINADGTVNSWNEIKWQQKNQGDIKYAWVQGTGNPAAEIKAEEIASDGVPQTYWVNGVEYIKYRPAYTYYNPDGSLGAPEVGLHYQFKAKVAGTIKVAVWINKGNRKFYVVDGETALPVAYKAEGYINGQNEKVPDETTTEVLDDSITRKKWLSTEEIDSIHAAAKVGEDGVDSAPYIVGAGNQAFWGNIIFEMEAGKTYYVFNDNTQLGFQGYEFTPAGGSDVEQPTDALFSWDAGVVAGGTVVGNGADAESVTTEIRVSAKKDNIATDNITITLDNELQATDNIEITAYRKKDTDANGTLYIVFGNGYIIDQGDNKVWNNILLDQEPNTLSYTVGEGAGSKTITLTRSKSSTNVFITKFVITRGGSDSIGEIKFVKLDTDAPMYNIAGQLVNKGYKGFVFQKGKKFLLR